MDYIPDAELITFNLNNLKKRVEKIENVIELKNENLEDIERINSSIRIIAKHISVLEKRNKSFWDRFKIGKFRPIGIEEALKQKTPKKEISFSLNDD